MKEERNEREEKSKGREMKGKRSERQWKKK